MDAIFQTTFSIGFYWMEMHEFRFKFHWSLLLSVQLTISQHWFRQWLGADQATSHYLNQWWWNNWRINASLGLNELTAQLVGNEKFWYVLCIPKQSIHQMTSKVTYTWTPTLRILFWEIMTKLSICFTMFQKKSRNLDDAGRDSIFQEHILSEG